MGFNSPVGGGRTATSSARRKVRSRRAGSNSAPKALYLGPAATHSRRSLRLAGGDAALAAATNGAGTIAYHPGLAAGAAGTAADRSADRHSSPPRGARAAPAWPAHARPGP